MPAGTIIVKVEVPGTLTLRELNWTQRDDDPRLTTPVKPFNAFRVTVEVSVLPVVNALSVDGLAEIEKSGVGDAPKLVVIGLPSPVTRS